MTSTRREFLRNSLTLALVSPLIPGQLLAIFRPSIESNSQGQLVAIYTIKISERAPLATVGGTIRLEQLSELLMNPDHCENSGADDMDYPIAITRVAESGPDAFEAVSTWCTHASGFSVEYDATEKVFICPHQQSRFQVDGTHISGPANGNLRSFPITFDGVDTITISDLLTNCVAAMDEQASIPSTAVLHQNSPNPAQHLTVIRYAIALAGNVRLTLHTVDGKEVLILADGRREPGEYLHDLPVDSLAAGSYYYRLTTGESTLTRKLTVVR